MKPPSKATVSSHRTLIGLLHKAQASFHEYYIWLEENMPRDFFEDMDPEKIIHAAQHLQDFELQDYFTVIRFKDSAIILCLDEEDSDLKVSKQMRRFGVAKYKVYVSNKTPPNVKNKHKLKVTYIIFTDTGDNKEAKAKLAMDETLVQSIQEKHQEIKKKEIQEFLAKIDKSNIKSLSKLELETIGDLYFRTKNTDLCQYEFKRISNFKKAKKSSLHVFIAWKNIPKAELVYKLIRVMRRHNLLLRSFHGVYLDYSSKQNTLIMVMRIAGRGNQAACDICDLKQFFQELIAIRLFELPDEIERVFIETKYLAQEMGNFLRSLVSFVHQMLLQSNPDLYSYENIIEAVCRHPELTALVCKAFVLKFHPKQHDLVLFEQNREEFLALVSDLDTGHEMNDNRRKNVLKTSMNFVHFMLKTNFFKGNKLAYCFRLDPKYMDELPYDRKELFPELPYGIFFIVGKFFIGFHIRFRELSRGGLRTIYTQRLEQMIVERNFVFTECYNLALTQQKKNKDIPEGGAKGVIFLEPYTRMEKEISIYKKELRALDLSEDVITEKITHFDREHKLEFLYEAQRAYVFSLLTIINCDEKGVLKRKGIIDYLKKPEYIYLGPDENMHNVMIDWIADLAKQKGYIPGKALISSKPKTGINHKQYGVTSYGVNVYMVEALKALDIDPEKEEFTIKISGGPDGDVAGNQIHNLYRFFPNTAKLLAITDVSGTIFDPNGLDLEILNQMFEKAMSIRNYPVEKINDGGFLLDLETKREESAYTQTTLCYRVKEGRVLEDWLTGNEKNHLFRTNMHSCKADIFIPAGGRPRTLNEQNIYDFLDESGNPTSKAIVEGANLYLTPNARSFLEKLGVLIIKDSSANKGGVTCSSFEVLLGLVLDDEQFLEQKETLMQEILDAIAELAFLEANLLLTTFAETKRPLTEISDHISYKINQFTDQLFEFFNSVTIDKDPKSPWNRLIAHYCLPTLREKYLDQVIHRLPDTQKKAILAAHIASLLVYKRGIDWWPSLTDILPLIVKDQTLFD